ncbi:DUF4237 domain-containing protein [Xanthomonas oryzae]|nr:DUF4237 domain-containing protein [Xanthomonas oryzae]
MPPHSEQIVSRICGALFRGSLEQAEASKNPEEIAAAKQQLQAAQADYAQWDEGGTKKRALQVTASVVSALVSDGNVGAAALGVLGNEILLNKVSAFLNQRGQETGSVGHTVAMALSGLAISAAGGALAGDAGAGAAAGTAAQQYGYYGYRDGLGRADTEVSQLMEEFAKQNPGTTQTELDALKATLLGTVKMGGTVADLTAALSVPGFLSNLAEANQVQAFALANYGANFNSLSQEQQQAVVKEFMRYGKVGPATDLTSDGSAANQSVSELSAMQLTSTELGFRQKAGEAFSDGIVSAQRGTQKVVNWLGEDSATAAGLAVMMALGGPVKVVLGMGISASPIGQGIDAAKNGITDWLTPINGAYLFGANSDDAQQAVYPASHAVAGTTTELGAGLLGAGLSASVKGIIGLSKGFAEKVDAAAARSVEKPVASAIADSEAGGFSYYDNFKKPDGTWDWPKDLGFAEPPTRGTLPVGTKLDRYGDPNGSFLSPKGTPYDQRALAPGSRGGGYYQYEVVKPLPVIQGKIAPAFDQPGGGTQILPGLTERVNVNWLLDKGYLKEVK